MQLETPLNVGERSSETEEKLQRLDAISAKDGIDLIQVVALLWRNKKTISRFVLLTGVLTTLVAFFVLKPTFTANAVFLPPQSAPGSAMNQLMGQIGSLGAVGALGGLKSSGDVYIGILGSRTIADMLVKRFDLQSVYKTKRLSDTETMLKNNSKFVAGKDSLITISVVDDDPQRAASLANGYLDALYEQNGRLALTESGQRRVFFEQQLVREKDVLADAEVELKKTQEQTGMIIPAGQAQVAIEAMQQLRAQITSRQVGLGVLQQSATDRNPEVVRSQIEIERLQEQLRKLENNSSQRTPGSVDAPTAKVPELALEYVRKQREVKYHETLFELLARQYESARLDESREAPLLQVVDKAIVPDRKSGPHRALLVLGGSSLGLIAGVLWVILRDAFKNYSRSLSAIDNPQ
ncbi:Wzz/FepE/Etk N-terminal domain-containing protein [Granulicella sp. dw_53]|uniref:GumC family protein n=1 Tax=Granulicella sp. dw_53 TaxID=2719792 RepID=UPI001BD5949A|nr:Wzz/FepE/Etk N-terminal domain-containing protein [Granulicella sp. dw_53]